MNDHTRTVLAGPAGGVNGRQDEHVVAELQFLETPDGRPRVYAYDPPDGEPRISADFAKKAIAVRNARRLADRPSLDKYGFALVNHVSKSRSFHDETDLRSIYYHEVEEVVRSATGAAAVVAFDHNVRMLDGQRRGPAPVYGAVLRAHNDYTAASGLERAREILALHGRVPTQRTAIVNVWRALRAPLLHMPLAVCDARSVDPAELVTVDLVYPDRSGEIYYVTYGAQQSWYYFPRLLRDELLLIKVFDTELRDVARFTPHVAFEDPTTPPDAPPRESIEVRTIVSFEDKDVSRH